MPFKQFANASNQLFGFATCISLNDEIVNGLPSQERLIQSGDIVSIATAAEHRGLYAKAARSFFVGTLSPPEAITRLLSGTRLAIEQAVINAGQCNTLNDLLCYIPQVAASFQLTVIEMMGGQQIGKKLHGEIPTPNNPKELDWVVPLQPGLCFTLMPMFSLGTQSAIQVGKDGWVYHTADGALSAHVAETLLMTESGLVVITRSE
jgi:methionyl aminopeptidase